jgi:hypothetical protein
VKFTGSTPRVGGPGIISVEAPFTGGDDLVNAPVQIRLVTADSTVA